MTHRSKNKNNPLFFLKRHMQWHVNHPGFVCRTCRYELENKDALKAHMEQHKIKSPFECVLCDKSFNDQKNLKRHMTRHVCYFDFYLNFSKKICQFF